MSLSPPLIRQFLVYVKKVELHLLEILSNAMKQVKCVNNEQTSQFTINIQFTIHLAITMCFNITEKHRITCILRLHVLFAKQNK